MASKNFFDLFPPPSFLLMPAAGISISEDAVRYIQFKEKSGVISLVGFGEEKLPPGSIDEGAPAKSENIVAALRKLKKDHKISFANVALPEDKAFVFKSVVSVPKGANLADSVGFILEENIPLSPAETVFDFSVLKEDRVALTDEVVVSAFPEEAVERYLDVCKQAGIKVLQFDLESEAVRRAVVSHGDETTRLLVNFTLDKVVLAVASHGLVQFVSMVNQIAASESTGMSGLVEEIRKVCSYFQSSASNKGKVGGKVGSIVVVGNVDPKLNIASNLSKHTGIQTSLGNVWQNAFSFDEIIPGISFEDSLKYASAIGLALP